MLLVPALTSSDSATVAEVARRQYSTTYCVPPVIEIPGLNSQSSLPGAAVPVNEAQFTPVRGVVVYPPHCAVVLWTPPFQIPQQLGSRGAVTPSKPSENGTDIGLHGVSCQPMPKLPHVPGDVVSPTTGHAVCALPV